MSCISYSVCLAQGRYRWRHNQVLSRYPEKERKKKRGQKEEKKFFQLVREVDATSVEKPQNRNPSLTSWKMQADLGRRLVFPTIIATNLRPDIILWSYECKKIIMVGLTIPWEERERRPTESKVPEFCGRHSQQWIQCMGISIGCWLQMVPCPIYLQSNDNPLNHRKVWGKNRIQRLSIPAEKSSCWLWLGRAVQNLKLSTER